MFFLIICQLYFPSCPYCCLWSNSFLKLVDPKFLWKGRSSKIMLKYDIWFLIWVGPCFLFFGSISSIFSTSVELESQNCLSICTWVHLFNFFDQTAQVYVFILDVSHNEGSVLRPKRFWPALPISCLAQKLVLDPKMTKKECLFIWPGLVIYCWKAHGKEISKSKKKKKVTPPHPHPTLTTNWTWALKWPKIFVH